MPSAKPYGCRPGFKTLVTAHCEWSLASILVRFFLVLLLFKREWVIRTLSLDCAKRISNYSTNLDM